MDRSSGVVMKRRTRSALAPTYAVVTVMAAFSLRGYGRTLSERTACTPAMTIRRLTTTARTGRRMNRSVNFIASSLVVGGLGSGFAGGRQFVVDRQRAAVVELEGAARDDGLARVQPGRDPHQIAAPLAEAHELLPRHQRLLLLLDGQDRSAVGRVEQRRRTDHQP